MTGTLTVLLRFGLAAYTLALAAVHAVAFIAGAALGEVAGVASVWFLGWFPLTEGLIAVGTGAALGLTPSLNVAAAVTGNLLVLPVVYGAGAWLDRYWWMRRLRARAEAALPRVRAHLDRWGGPAVAVLTPWIGAWATAIALEALKASRPLKLMWPTLGILAQCALLQGLVLAGLAAAG